MDKNYKMLLTAAVLTMLYWPLTCEGITKCCRGAPTPGDLVAKGATTPGGDWQTAVRQAVYHTVTQSSDFEGGPSLDARVERDRRLYESVKQALFVPKTWFTHTIAGSLVRDLHGDLQFKISDTFNCPSDSTIATWQVIPSSLTDALTGSLTGPLTGTLTGSLTVKVRTGSNQLMCTEDIYSYSRLQGLRHMESRQTPLVYHYTVDSNGGRSQAGHDNSERRLLKPFKFPTAGKKLLYNASTGKVSISKADFNQSPPPEVSIEPRKRYSNKLDAQKQLYNNFGSSADREFIINHQKYTGFLPITGGQLHHSTPRATHHNTIVTTPRSHLGHHSTPPTYHNTIVTTPRSQIGRHLSPRFRPSKQFTIYSEPDPYYNRDKDDPFYAQQERDKEVTVPDPFNNRDKEVIVIHSYPETLQSPTPIIPFISVTVSNNIPVQLQNGDSSGTVPKNGDSSGTVPTTSTTTTRRETTHIDVEEITVVTTSGTPIKSTTEIQSSGESFATISTTNNNKNNNNNDGNNENNKNNNSNNNNNNGNNNENNNNGNKNVNNNINTNNKNKINNNNESLSNETDQTLDTQMMSTSNAKQMRHIIKKDTTEASRRQVNPDGRVFESNNVATTISTDLERFITTGNSEINVLDGRLNEQGTTTGENAEIYTETSELTTENTPRNSDIASSKVTMSETTINARFPQQPLINNETSQLLINNFLQTVIGRGGLDHPTNEETATDPQPIISRSQAEHMLALLDSGVARSPLDDRMLNYTGPPGRIQKPPQIFRPGVQNSNPSDLFDEKIINSSGEKDFIRNYSQIFDLFNEKMLNSSGKKDLIQNYSQIFDLFDEKMLNLSGKEYQIQNYSQIFDLFDEKMLNSSREKDLIQNYSQIFDLFNEKMLNSSREKDQIHNYSQIFDLFNEKMSNLSSPEVQNSNLSQIFNLFEDNINSNSSAKDRIGKFLDDEPLKNLEEMKHQIKDNDTNKDGDLFSMFTQATTPANDNLYDTSPINETIMMSSSSSMSPDTSREDQGTIITSSSSPTSLDSSREDQGIPDEIIVSTISPPTDLHGLSPVILLMNEAHQNTEKTNSLQQNVMKETHQATEKTTNLQQSVATLQRQERAETDTVSTNWDDTVSNWDDTVSLTTRMYQLRSTRSGQSQTTNNEDILEGTTTLQKNTLKTEEVFGTSTLPTDSIEDNTQTMIIDTPTTDISATLDQEQLTTKLQEISQVMLSTTSEQSENAETTSKPTRNGRVELQTTLQAEMRSEEVETTSEKAETTLEQVETTSQPVETASETVETTSVPVKTSETVETTSEKAETASEQVVTTLEGVETTSEPVKTSETVETTSEKAETASEKAVTTLEGVETTSEPVETTSEPVETTSGPFETTSQPSRNARADLQTTLKAETTKQQVEITTEQVEPTPKQVAITSQQVEPTLKQVEPTLKQVEPTLKQVAITSKPVEPDSTTFNEDQGSREITPQDLETARKNLASLLATLSFDLFNNSQSQGSILRVRNGDGTYLDFESPVFNTTEDYDLYEDDKEEEDDEEEEEEEEEGETVDEEGIFDYDSLLFSTTANSGSILDKDSVTEASKERRRKVIKSNSH